MSRIHRSIKRVVLLISTLLVVITLLKTSVVRGLNVGSAASIFRKAKANNIKAAVLVPGFLTGAEEFASLCDELGKCGLPTVAVPMPYWHWISCLGGRSVRPMLERIDFTVKWLLASGGDISKIPNFSYSAYDCFVDFRTNPGGILKVGGYDSPDDYRLIEPRGTFPLPDESELPPNAKIALIGHSAGGWISRVYVSDRKYGGKVYGGRKYIHSLVTLGTPHLYAPGPAFEGIKWCNQEPVTSVRALAVGGTGFKGDEWGSLTQASYLFCAPDGFTDVATYTGDGITPIQSAVAMNGAEQMTLDQVTHFCWSEVFGSELIAPELTKDYKNGRPWYGSPGIVEKWAEWIVR